MRAASNLPLSETDVLGALRDCYHPQIRANIVELGLVHSIAIAHDPDAPGAGIPGVPERYRVQIRLLSLEPGPEVEAQLVALIQNRLAAFPTISRSSIKPVPEPVWTADFVAPELRERLSLAIASNQRPHALVQIQTVSAKPRKEP